MLRSIGLPELTVLFFGFCALILIPAIFYLLTLQKALERCPPQSRTMPPGQVWLLLIPFFNLIWHFIVVNSVAASLRNEFTKRNIPLAEPEPGKPIGLALCIASVGGIVPLLNLIAGPIGLVCWVMYWVKISGYSSLLIPPLATS
jgi:hypothetical protein